MKMAWKLRPAEFRLGLIAAALIGCWGLVSLVLQPQWDRLQALEMNLETQLERRQAFERLFAQAPQVEELHERVRPFLEAARAEGGEGALLTELEQLSREANVLLNLKPRALKAEKDTRRYELELDLEGGQGELMGFLDGLFRLPRLFTVERLRIATVPARADILRANVVIQLITLPGA